MTAPRAKAVRGEPDLEPHFLQYFLGLVDVDELPTDDGKQRVPHPLVELVESARIVVTDALQ